MVKLDMPNEPQSLLEVALNIRKETEQLADQSAEAGADLPNAEDDLMDATSDSVQSS